MMKSSSNYTKAASVVIIIMFLGALNYTIIERKSTTANGKVEPTDVTLYVGQSTSVGSRFARSTRIMYGGYDAAGALRTRRIIITWGSGYSATSFVIYVLEGNTFYAAGHPYKLVEASVEKAVIRKLD